MGIKSCKLIFCCLIVALTTFSNCKRKYGCAETKYSFEIGASVLADRDSIRIGDTVWLKVQEPVRLNDLTSRAVIDYSKAANLGTLVSLYEFLSGTASRGAVLDFSFILKSGSIVNNNKDPASFKEFLFVEKNGFYIFELGLVANKVGRFVLTISDATNVYRTTDACTKASFAINFKQTNQHFYFIGQWRPDLTLDDQGKKKVYYFKVI